MMTQFTDSKIKINTGEASDTLALRVLWLLLSLAVFFSVWVSGSPLPICLLVGGLMAFPAILHIVFARFWEQTIHEIEMASWIVVVMIGATATGGALSPLSISFFIPVMTALSLGRKRHAMEASAFAVLGFCLAALLSRMHFLPYQTGQLDPAPALAALFSIIYMAALVRHVQLGASVNSIRAYLERQYSTHFKKLVHENKGLNQRIQKNSFQSSQLAEKVRVLEKTAQEAQKELESRSLFFAKTSHELRTPLNAILGFSEMMKEGVFGPLPDKYKEYSEFIHEGGKSLQLIVDDLLDWSKLEAGAYEIDPQLISLSEHVFETVRFMGDQAKRNDVRLHFVRQSDVEAYADPRAVRQIALNLISNAIKFSPQDGVVAVSVDESNEGAWLRVKDQGEGLKQEDFESLLNPYVQTSDAVRSKVKGTGLGLTVVKGFVDMHKGDLKLDSEPGAGSLISVFFPKRAFNQVKDAELNRGYDKLPDLES